MGMQNEEGCADITFLLLETRDTEAVNIKYKGGWKIVDNCYLAWSTLIPPLELPTCYVEMWFSTWLESMRKDVKYTYGVMKGRFGILKTGISL